MKGNAGLDQGALIRLRALVRAIHEGDGRAVPLVQLVDLASRARLDAGVTVDFEASKELGQPFVVLRLPVAAQSDPCLTALSGREREVAALLTDGLSNKQIACRLRITLATVKDHVHRILRKTGLPNRAAVAAAFKGSMAVPREGKSHDGNDRRT
jgi:DNA-binding NarL/FixJ family response regulator